MKNVSRFDFQTLPIQKPVKTDSGFLRVPIRATRVGIFEYLQKDGSIRREFRPPEEVFSKESMDSLAGVPLTVRHPNQMVNTKNVKGLSVGMTGDVVSKAEDRYLDIVGTVTDEVTVKSLERKSDNGDGQQVSCGYTADMDFTPGIWKGQTYDAIQRNIRYNHVALVDLGRAGPEARIKLDENDNAIYSTNDNQGVVKMKNIKIDGKEFEVNEELHGAISSLQTKMDAMKKNEGDMKKKMEEDEDEMKKMKKEKDEMEAKKDSLASEVSSLKEAAKTAKLDHNEIDGLVAERANVCDVAEKIVKDFKKDGKSNLDIKKEVISAVSPDLKLDEKSEDYINARFDSISEQEGMYVDHLAKAMEKKDEDDKNKKETKVDSASARDKMISDSQDAWKTGLE